MNLVEQNPSLLIPYVLLMLFMVHAMMEFTVSLLVQRPPAGRKPVGGAELRQRLLAAQQPGNYRPLVEGKDCDLEMSWESSAAPPSGRFAIAKGATRYRIRFLLDEPRHELRMNQVSRSYGLFLGWDGWLPRLSGYASAQAGPPGQFSVREISRSANRCGWYVRPVLWWFQATYSGYHLLETLTPPPLRRWPARRYWGILYPLSYMLAVGYLMLIIGQPSARNLLIVFAVSFLWWGIWAALAWALCGFPAFWRRR